MVSQEETDHRLFERFTARFPAKFKDTRQDFGTNVFLRDASATGLRLSSKDRLFVNDHLSLEIELPDGKAPLVLTGEVRWSKPLQNMWESGVSFHRVSLMQMQRLFHFASLVSG